MIHKKFAAAAFLVLLAGIQHGSGATLALYQFTTDLNVTTKDTQVTATAFSGTGTARSSSSYAFQYPAAGNSGYMEFTLAADPGFAMDFSSVAFSYDFLQSSGTNAPVSATFGLYYSTDGFVHSTLIQSYGDTSGTPNASAPTFTGSGVIDTSSMPVLDAVAFRFVLANSGSLNTNSYRYAIDNVILSGDMVAVPEPSAYLLVICGLGGLVLLRRKTKTAR